MIRLRLNKADVTFESLTWAGTDTQASRNITFTIPSNPYDQGFINPDIALGDLVYLYEDTTLLFVGQITTRNKSASVGTAEYTANDFMNHLLRSSGTYKFKNKTPEAITKKLCGSVGVQTTALAKTKVNIPKVIYEDQSIYDIIIGVYRKAKASTGKKYMLTMVGKKVSVIEKGKSSGVTLTQGSDITDASFADTLDNMINKVIIYNENQKKLGEVKNSKYINKYGTYQATYTKEKGVNAKSKAKAQMEGITKEASVDSIGYVNAISGKSIVINDPATGLGGRFFITSDSHSFTGSVHTMSLEIRWSNVMENGADPSESGSNKKALKNSSKAYYLDGATCYHSSKTCSAIKGKKSVKTSTVGKLKKILNRNKKRKYKACSKCWET